MLFEQVERSHVGCRRKGQRRRIIGAAGPGLWAVADGVGGQAAGDLASALVVDSWGGLLSDRSSLCGRKPPRLPLKKQTRPCGKWRAQAARTIGSTIVALAVGDDGYCCLWAGDSRAYLLRDGNLRQLTRDHSLVQQLVDFRRPGARSSHQSPQFQHHYPRRRFRTEP